MPKRTNPFQELITFIYTQISKDDATITPSALIEDTQGTEREIDILIEFQEAGHVYRTAVECRDRSRKDDIKWIDELIGKYKNLSTVIHKKVAVSSSGFSESAKRIAAQEGIETLTMEEAKEVEWNTFIKPGISLFRRIDKLSRYSVRFLPNNHRKLENEDSTKIIVIANEDRFTLRDFVHNRLAPEGQRSISKYVNDSFFEKFPTLADLKEAMDIELETRLKIKDNIVAIIDNIEYKIEEITCWTKSTFIVQDFVTKHYTLNRDTVRISVAQINEQSSINVVQSPLIKRSVLVRGGTQDATSQLFVNNRLPQEQTKPDKSADEE